MQSARVFSFLKFIEIKKKDFFIELNFCLNIAEYFFYIKKNHIKHS